MHTDQQAIGIDRQHERTRIAQVNWMAGRPIIESLYTAETPDTTETTASMTTRRVYSVSERAAIIRHIQIGKDETYTATQRAHFELVQSLLDSEENFALDVFPSHSRERFIGVAVHRTELPVLTKAVDANQPSGFQVRAIALAKGFSAFCDHSHGDFHCILDVTPTGISIVFLYQGVPARISYMERPNTADLSYKALAGDLKTALSFHGNTLFHEGITVPLSHIHISVDESDQPLVTALREYSHLEMQAPVLNRFSLGPAVTVAPDMQHRYLVALGLALE